MVVAAARVELHVHGSRSLKQKRSVVRKITQRVSNRFNISVAEVGGQDTWQHVVLGLATVAGQGVAARRKLERAIDFIEGLHLAEVRAREVAVEIW